MSLKLAVIGLSEGNGHPYSWSAIFNGYNPVPMEDCGFPVIPRYLEQQTWPEDCLMDAKVTHVWTQDKQLSNHIAQAAYIPNVVDNMLDVIDEVDAVLLARDDAENHLSFAEPFLNAGLPLYIDKPICLSVNELEQLYALEKYPGQIFSCSALRFAREFQLSEGDITEIGPLVQIHAIVPKDWDRYSVHVIEPLLALAGNQGAVREHQKWRYRDTCTNHYAWESGFQASVTTMGSLGCPLSLRVIGECGWKDLFFSDTFYAFKTALNCFVQGVFNREVMSDVAFLQKVVEMIELGRKS
ncbi:Gfo/Idh/MocA family oxidoreductase [Desulfuromonas acetoxidans]|uniref:Gfo/Idh/MocA family oxidoreductase n=1 Tax=Desulfuromonas acetoxidans TaxID=891 RepID=UPI0029315739|nr:Gfo/Idh/MocA family oxidoreductase [Desulfuromonas acetoxidans]